MVEKNLVEVMGKFQPCFIANSAFGEIILLLKQDNKSYKLRIDGNYTEYMMNALYFCMQKTSDGPTDLSYEDFIAEIDKYMMTMRMRYWYIQKQAVDQGILKNQYSSLPPGWYHVTSDKSNTGETEVLGPMQHVKETIKVESSVKLGPISRFFHWLGL